MSGPSIDEPIEFNAPDDSTVPYAKRGPKPIIPDEYASPKAPAAYALREAKDRGRAYSINRKVGAYTKEIFKGVF